MRNTWEEKSQEEKNDIVDRTLATKEKRGNKNSWSKAEKTMIVRLGEDYGKKRAAKAEETMLQEYGIRNALVKDSKFRGKAERTNLELYGSVHPTSNEEIKNRLVSTYTERHGGMGNASKTAQQRYKETMLEEHGVENPMHDKDIVKKVSEAYKKVGKYKAAETKKRNGTTPKQVAWKGHETKKKNGSYTTNKSEQYILQRLRSLLGSQVVHLYRDNPGYPWEADFYDPSTGTVYEYQGYFTHGKEPYDSTSKEHRKIVRELRVKAKSDKWAAKLHISIWTQTDPLKRATASTNNVPFVEWFTIKEFEEWLCTKIKKWLGAVKVRDNCFKLKNGLYAAHSTSSYAGTDKRVIVFNSDTPLRKLAKSIKKGTK